MNTKRDPGTPVIFIGPYGEHRFGVTDGREGECWRVIEFDPDEAEGFEWLVHPDYIVMDPEHSETYEYRQPTKFGYPVLTLPVLVAGCICAWVGLFMLVTGDLSGVFGFVLFGLCFYWAYLLCDDEGGE